MSAKGRPRKAHLSPSQSNVIPFLTRKEASAIPSKGSDTLEFFPTPSWAVEPIVTRLRVHAETDKARDALPCVSLDPFAGTGSILRCTNTFLGSARGIELDPDRTRITQNQGFPCELGDSIANIDYLPTARWIVTNPPFSQAALWLSRILPERAKLRHKPIIAMLVRMAFAESKERAWLHETYPAHMMVMSERVSFTGDGATDSSAYAWFVWGDGCPGRWSIVRSNHKQKTIFDDDPENCVEVHSF